MKFFVAGLMMLLLAACAPSAGPSGGAPVAVSDPATLLTQLDRLPGAEVGGEPLQFSYPEQSLFGPGAVLPLPGGTAVLDPLAEFLRANPGSAWQVDVRARTEYGDGYDQALAEKRSELLATYLLSRKVDLKRLHFNPLAAAGTPLTFTLMLPVAKKP